MWAKIGSWFGAKVLIPLIERGIKWIVNLFKRKREEKKRSEANQEAAQNHSQSTTAEQAGTTFGEMP